mmetsp:Transcript_29883/g.53099  ORF Transcript_29883/g.53099 Transcript_29883/m.53099 type:complete len:167 (-) Transcript_29883:26-526(-)
MVKMLKETPSCLQPAALEVMHAFEYNSPVMSLFATVARELNSLIDITRSYFHIRIAIKPSTPQTLGLDVGLQKLFQAVEDETAKITRLCEVLRASLLIERSKAVDHLAKHFSVSSRRRRRKKATKKLSDLSGINLQAPELHSNFDSEAFESALSARWHAELLKSNV